MLGQAGSLPPEIESEIDTISQGGPNPAEQPPPGEPQPPGPQGEEFAP
jgi:hypothetical protein